MDVNLRKFFTKSIIVLVIVHLCYFIYGYFQFWGIKNIDIYSEFYRFKFYDDVSISHFFASSLFLSIFLFLLTKNHSNKKYSFINLIKISFIILTISFLCFSFFISFSFGLNAKLKTELSEIEFNEDKVLLNTLNPFLYKYTSYRSEKLFNIQNILYPKPYPVVQQIDTLFYSDSENFSIENNYYSIDTLKFLKSKYDDINSKADTIFDVIGFNKEELIKRIISKTILHDSIKIIYKGMEINPNYDDSICIFLQNKILFNPINQVSIYKQQLQSAKYRYKLLYKFKQDSLLHKFQDLDTVFKKYNIETNIKPQLLNKDVFYYRDEYKFDYYPELNAIRNNFDRNSLIEKFNTINKLFYQPQYLHISIRTFFFTLIFLTWFIIILVFVINNYRKIELS